MYKAQLVTFILAPSQLTIYNVLVFLSTSSRPPEICRKVRLGRSRQVTIFLFLTVSDHK